MPNGRTAEIWEESLVQHPTVGEVEQYHFMALLWAYLQQYTATGAMAPATARAIYESQWQALHPTVEDRPLTSDEVAALSTEEAMKWAADPEGYRPRPPEAKAIQALPYFKTVTNWAQKQATARGQELEDFAEQMTAWQSQRAEAVGRAQREEWDIRRSQQRGMAAVGALTPERPIRTTAETPEFEPEEAFGAALGGLSYTAQRWFGGRLGEVMEEFEQAYPGALGAWQAALRPLAYQRPKTAAQYREQAAMMGRVGGRLPELPMGYETYEEALRAGVPGTPTPTEVQARMAALMNVPTLEARAGELEAMTSAERRERRERPETPMEAWQKRYGAADIGGLWEQYLQQYPFMEKFTVVPRRARGFYPRSSIARARWFV